LKENWLGILLDLANDVYLAVNPILGTPESREVVGRGASGDLTMRIDIVAENIIIQHLEREKISCIFIGEEKGIQKIGDKPEVYLVVDSIDGTTNAVRGISFVSTSIAVSPTNRLSGIEVAVVKKLDDEGTYTARKGRGAYYNRKKIDPSKVTKVEDAVLSVELSRTPEIVEKAVPILRKAKVLRSLGSAALEMCYVASSRLDGYIDIRGKLRTTDIAAGALILKEAGGILLKPDGQELNDVPLVEINHFSFVAAANREIFQDISSLLGKV